MEVKVCRLLNKQFGFLLKSLRGNKSVGDSASFFQSPHSSHNSNSPSTAAQKKVEAFQYKFNLCMFNIFHILCWVFIMAKTTWFSWFWGSLRLPSWYSWSCSRIKLPSRRQQATRSATSHYVDWQQATRLSRTLLDSFPMCSHQNHVAMGQPHFLEKALPAHLCSLESNPVFCTILSFDWLGWYSYSRSCVFPLKFQFHHKTSLFVGFGLPE